MRVVVSGGTGFIGRALTASLDGDGHEVIVLSRHRAPAVAPGAQVVRWRGGADDAQGEWRRLVDGADAMVNLAGASLADGRWTETRRRAILESRVRATRALVQAMADAGTRPQALVSASAVGYYGPLGDERVTEAHGPGSDFLAGVCAAWEEEARAAEALGVRVVLLRTGLVLGRGGGALPRLAMPFRLFLGGPLGGGRQWMPWIHIDDVVGIIRLALERGDMAGPVNVTAPGPVRNREFARALGRALGRPAVLPAPAFALRLALGDMADALLLSGQRAVPERAAKAGYAFRHADLTRALGNLLP